MLLSKHEVVRVLLFLSLIFPNFAQEPYESVCLSESDFQSGDPVFYACFGSDAQACTDFGGNYNDYEQKCDDIDTDTPDDCESIPGFTYEVESTCEDMAAYFSMPGMLDCYNPMTGYYISIIQSTCCGGTSNNKDVCTNIPKPYESFCLSESDFKSDEPLFYACYGSDAQACTDFGGEYDVEDQKCDDIDTETPDDCESIPGFTYKVESTCEQMGVYATLPEFSVVCSDPMLTYFYLSKIHSTCCGGIDNNKDICPDTDFPTGDDVCSKCDRNIDTAGVSDDCYETVSIMINSGYDIEGVEACGEPEKGSDVSVECKSVVLSGFGCVTEGEESVSTDEDSTSPSVDASKDIEDVDEDEEKKITPEEDETTPEGDETTPEEDEITTESSSMLIAVAPAAAFSMLLTLLVC